MMMVNSRMALIQSPCPLRLPARRITCCAVALSMSVRAFFAQCGELPKIQTIVGRIVRCKGEVSKIVTMGPRVLPCYEDKVANRHTVWELTPPNSATCILPLCLALLLAAPHPGFAFTQNQAAPPSPYQILSERGTETRMPIASRIDRAISCLERGKQAQAQGDFSRALL